MAVRNPRGGVRPTRRCRTHGGAQPARGAAGHVKESALHRLTPAQVAACEQHHAAAVVVHAVTLRPPTDNAGRPIPEGPRGADGPEARDLWGPGKPPRPHGLKHPRRTGRSHWRAAGGSADVTTQRAVTALGRVNLRTTPARPPPGGRGHSCHAQAVDKSGDNGGQPVPGGVAAASIHRITSFRHGPRDGCPRGIRVAPRSAACADAVSSPPSTPATTTAGFLSQGGHLEPAPGEERHPWRSCPPDTRASRSPRRLGVGTCPVTPA